MNVDDPTQHYRGLAAGYDEYRPAYPPPFLVPLAKALAMRPPDRGDVLDVGAGTGIFTRQLRETLPGEMPIIGIEPNADMLEQARSATTALRNISFLLGSAETLPVETASARAVVAATAAHWFKRPAFYAEATRTLLPNGALGIIHYFRDQEQSAVVQAFLALLAEHGAPKAPPRPDYISELSALDAFDDVEHLTERRALPLNFTQFAGLCLSTPLIRPVIAHLGQSGTEHALHEIARRHADADGIVQFGYVFQYFLTRRR